MFKRRSKLASVGRDETPGGVVDTATKSRNAALWNAISLLASACDGARQQDGVGFNSLDSKFGKRIAAIDPGDWTEEIATDASAILPIYRVQLAGYGVNVADLPLVEGATRSHVARDQARAAERKPYAIVRSGEIRVFNSFAIKDDLKPAGYRFAGLDKSWTATLSPETAAKVIDLGVELRDGAEDIKAAASEPAETVRKPRGTVMYDSKADLIIIETAYGVIPLGVIRALPGRKWDRVNMVNTCYPEPVVLEITEQYGLDISPIARDAIDGRAKRVAASYATETDATVALGDVLRPYQAAGVAYAAEHGRSLNADDMGLGKTLQAIATAETRNQFPVLITCPASLRRNWVIEISKWAPHRTTEIWDGKGVPPGTDYVVVSYEALTKAANG